ncbi:S8 family serine peptidase [Polaribacter sp.]|nr:S8 family serine peptidase [Polaribacter sp.]
MKKTIFLFVVFCSIQAFTQVEDAWLYLTDKPNASSFIENPLSILSQRALDRRSRQNISVGVTDVPVESSYYQILTDDASLTILGKSKWLNAIHVQGTVEDISATLQNYTFVNSIQFANSSLNSSAKNNEKLKIENTKNKWEVQTDFNYGTTENQIEMLGLDKLHQDGFTGKTMQIAIIDAGFPNVNTLGGFKRLRDNNQILGGYNFADRNTDFYTRNNHGSLVLSTVGGYLEGEYVGTAPDAGFYLFISEIAETETVLEETLWVEAAERADSLGVDVINTSLGYADFFDNSNHNHSYEDMDGKTTFISKGAAIGVTKGMILVTSIGNEGSSSYKYMGAPADVDGVFSVGAVDASGNIASFSSFGPSIDQRIKPNVLAQGQSSSVINSSSGNPTTSNGTSFSSPIMAGAIACFWEAFPNKTSFEIMEIVQQSGSLFNSPTDQGGYGIPDLEFAYNEALDVLTDQKQSFSISPNPVKNNITISNLNDTIVTSLQIVNTLGKVVKTQQAISNIDVSYLTNGIYFLKLENKSQTTIIKFIKI